MQGVQPALGAAYRESPTLSAGSATPPLGSGNVSKVKARFEKTKKIQLPGYAVWAPNMTEQENLSNDELRKCVNRNGYVMPEKSYQYQWSSLINKEVILAQKFKYCKVFVKTEFLGQKLDL